MLSAGYVSFSEAVAPVRVNRWLPSTGPADRSCSRTCGEIATSCYIGDMPSTPAPGINGVVETKLYTDDLGRATAFYRDVLGLREMNGDGQRFQALDSGANRVLLLFKCGGTLTPQPVTTGGFIPPHDGHGPLHVAFAIGADDYDAWCTRLATRQVAIESETRWERGGRSIYFRDPDNHLVELVTPGIWPNY
jgi:catechol 2,3-dioxygenase-like lactoylglutathione lyase family enzyme